MADIDLQQGRILPRATVLRWVDMGGGIHAPLISVEDSTVKVASQPGDNDLQEQILRELQKIAAQLAILTGEESPTGEG